MGGGKSLIIKRIASLKTFLLLLFFTSISFTSFAQIYYNCLGYELNNDGTNTVTLMGDACPPMSSNIVIPNSFNYNGTTYTVTRISNTGFKGVTAIQTIQLPKTLKTIDQATFQGCTGLTMVTIEDDGLESVLDSIYPHAFEGCTNLQNIQLPSNLSYIGANAFDSCSSLSGVFISFTGVTQIHSETFANCSNLGTIMFPGSLVTIDSFAFRNCISLTEIEIPTSTTSISNLAFMGCNNLESIYVSMYNTKYDSRGSSEAIIESDTDKLILGCKNSIIPDDIKTIGSYAFYGCDSLTSITIPSSVTQIEADAFKNCSNLVSAKIGCVSDNTTIGAEAFRGCTDLRNVIIETLSGEALSFTPSQLMTIITYNKQFKDCPNLTHIQMATNHFMMLAVKTWNYVSGVGNGAYTFNQNIPLSETVRYLQTSQDSTSVYYPHCDIAIMTYDYDNNNWLENGLYASSTMYSGAGYFVWPFEENMNGYTQAYEGELTALPYTPITDASRNISNTNRATTAPYYFAFGNSYSYAITKSNFPLTTGTIQGDILYTYNRSNGLWNTTQDSVYPGEGFFIATSTNKVVGSLKNPLNTSNSLPSNILKSTDEQDKWGIRFSVNANGISCDMFAKQENNAQDGFDTKDAYALFGNNENLVEPYFVVEGRQIIHNHFNSDNYACDVNFHCQKSGVAELSVSDVPEGTTVSIVDLTMNTETVLENEPYQIDVEAGENANRYQIKINKGSVSLPQTIEKEANITIWNNNKEIFVKGENLQRVEVYNTLGQMVYQKAISGESYNFTFDNEGAYIVKAATKNGIKTQKIVINANSV